MLIRILPWLILPVLASCVAPRTAVPAPAPPPRAPAAPTPAPPPAPPAERYSGDWSVADATPGDWRYAASGGASVARFGPGNEGMLAELRCERGTVTLVRSGNLPADIAAFINVRSSFAERRLPVQRALPGQIMASLPASDPLWDQLIYSRGRFLIEATRQAPIIVPNHPEVARVIEDCRG